MRVAGMSAGYEGGRRLLARPGAWIDEARDGTYAVRIRPDRRSRILMTLDEATLRRLIEDPGLRIRPGGGWVGRSIDAAVPPAPEPGRPGVVEGVRTIMNGSGRMEPHRANLAQSPIGWLSARSAATARPWIGRAERAAAERLTEEAEIALAGPSLTMRWDALPRSRGGSAARSEPSDRAMSAARRVEAALAACGPARRMIEQVCVRISTLQAAEQGLGLCEGEGRALLKQGLRALAAHYRIG